MEYLINFRQNSKNISGVMAIVKEDNCLMDKHMALGINQFIILISYFSPGQLDPVSSQAQTDAIVKSVSILLNQQG